jgi:hypothetical protein
MSKQWLFTNADDLQLKINDYFAHCISTNEIPDVEGLAVFLDTTRKTLNDYAARNNQDYDNKDIDFDSISATIKKAKDKIFFYKKQGAFKGLYNAAVFIFDAKNNHDYSDKQEIVSQNTNIELEAASFKDLQEMCENILKAKKAE